MSLKKESKFKIGQNVWHRFVSSNIKTTIRDIKIDYKGVPTYFCDFFLSKVAFREEELFESEEELLKSLLVWKKSISRKYAKGARTIPRICHVRI